MAQQYNNWGNNTDDDIWDDSALTRQYEKSRAALDPTSQAEKDQPSTSQGLQPIVHDNVDSAQTTSTPLVPVVIKARESFNNNRQQFTGLPRAPPPPPTPSQINVPHSNDTDDALSSMLMSWYMAGYQTGYYKAMTDRNLQKPK